MSGKNTPGRIDNRRNQCRRGVRVETLESRVCLSAAVDAAAEACMVPVTPSADTTATTTSTTSMSAVTVSTATSQQQQFHIEEHEFHHDPLGAHPLPGGATYSVMSFELDATTATA